MTKLLAEGKGGIAELGTYEVTRGPMVEHEERCPLDNYWTQDITIKVVARHSVSLAVIRSALLLELESGPCGHDYDCCGCSIVRVHRLKTVGDGVWAGVVHMSKNY